MMNFDCEATAPAPPPADPTRPPAQPDIPGSKPPPDSAVEAQLVRLGTPGFVLDLRRAPPEASAWLRQDREHWNGFVAAQFAPAEAFDVLYFVAPLTPACAQ